MGYRAGPRRGEAVFAGVRFEKGNEVLDSPDRQRRMDGKYRRRGDCDCDRVEVLVGIIRDLVIKCRVDDKTWGNNDDRITVGCSLCPLAHADIAAGASNVFDIELLGEMLRHFLCGKPREYIDRPPGRVWDDHAHRPRRIGLRPSPAREGWKCGSIRHQMQKSPTWIHCSL